MKPTIRLIEHGTADYDAMIALRRRILRAPLGLDFTPEQLAAERTDLLVAAFLDDQLIGCLVLTPKPDETLHMRQVAVTEEMQGRGIGRAMVAVSERLAAERGCREIVLHARETAVPFYLQLGYEIISDRYIEVTLPHLTMHKIL